MTTNSFIVKNSSSADSRITTMVRGAVSGINEFNSSQFGVLIPSGVVAEYIYTPVYTGSMLSVKFTGQIDISGFSGDDMHSQIQTDAGVTIRTFGRVAIYRDAAGGGGRSSYILPIDAEIIPSSQSPVTIRLFVQRLSGDDSVYVQGLRLEIVEIPPGQWATG